MTQSGIPYVLAGNAAGYFVYKDTEPALFIPFVNGTNPQLAATD